MMHLGKNYPLYNYTINNGDTVCPLSVTTSEKDLGFFIDPLLNFNDHITYTVKKARSLTGMILRSIRGRTKNILIPLFIGIVRPVLEYANPVWCPMYKKDIEKIEKVQRHFTKKISGINNLTYTERLKVLELPSLEFRRARGDMIETYKIVHGIYDELTTNSLFTRNHSTTRANSYKLFKPRFTTKKFQHFFSNRVINRWNNLPEIVVDAKSLNVFKNTLDKHWAKMRYSIDLSDF